MLRTGNKRKEFEFFATLWLHDLLVKTDRYDALGDSDRVALGLYGAVEDVLQDARFTLIVDCGATPLEVRAYAVCSVDIVSGVPHVAHIGRAYAAAGTFDVTIAAMGGASEVVFYSHEAAHHASDAPGTVVDPFPFLARAGVGYTSRARSQRAARIISNAERMMVR